MAVYKWDDLTTAVDNQWGGADSSDKRDWLVGSIVDLFEDNYIDAGDIEIRMLDVMDDEFGTVIEQGTSALPIAQMIINLYVQCEKEDFSLVVELYNKYQEQEQQRQAGLIKPNLVSTESDDDEDANDEEDTEMTNASSSTPKETSEPIIDDDGFELVQRRKR